MCIRDRIITSVAVLAIYAALALGMRDRFLYMEQLFMSPLWDLK